MFHERKSHDDVADSFHAAKQVQYEVYNLCAADIEMFLVAYVDSFIAQQQDCDVTCDV
jgi:hypothetical protein